MGILFICAAADGDVIDQRGEVLPDELGIAAMAIV
jgi:hypothetical protein